MSAMLQSRADDDHGPGEREGLPHGADGDGQPHDQEHQGGNACEPETGTELLQVPKVAHDVPIVGAVTVEHRLVTASSMCRES